MPIGKRKEKRLKIHISPGQKARVKTQDIIRTKYPDLLNEKLSSLCDNCQSQTEQGCKYTLLPITEKGEDCNYFIQTFKSG